VLIIRLHTEASITLVSAIVISACMGCSASPDVDESDVQSAREPAPSRSFPQVIQKTHSEVRRQKSAAASERAAKQIQSRATDVTVAVASARERCHPVDRGWLAIDVSVVSGTCSPDCIAASFVRDSWFRINLQNDVRQQYHEKYSLKRELNQPASLRATYVVDVTFDMGGESVDSTVKMESAEDPGEVEVGGWFSRLAEVATIRPIATDCQVRATFSVNAAHFAEPH
jgi:hypothetical protein